ncbi:MAG TPA: tetratricopeptide repeat protein [Myxococcota bacterium]|jgi:tetratricopeptide (TPR) repeat protein
MKRAALLALALGAAACATPAPPPEPEAQRAAPLAEEQRSERAADAAPDSPELAFLLAQQREHDGDLDGAYAGYQELLARDPNDAFLLVRLAQLAFRLDKAPEAREYAERALALNADDPWLRAFLAETYRDSGDLARVVDVLTDAAGDPVDGDAATQLYQVWMERGIYEQARRVARWQVDAEPEVPASWLNLAEVTEKQGDSAGAEKILREADRAHPEEVQFLAAIAVLRRGRSDRLGELGVLNELLARAPEDGASWLAKAEAEFDLGREDDGRRSLARAEEHQPADLRTTMRIALLDLQRGAYAEAEQRFARVAELYPEQYEIAYFLGIARRRSGDLEGALLAFDRIAENHPRFVDGRIQVAGILEAEGDLAAARIEVERAQAVKNTQTLAYLHASLVAKGGDVPGGVAELEAMLKGGPADAETLYNIGVVRGEARDLPGAIAAMERALALDPEHAGALNFIGYSLAERGERLDEAQALIERALARRPDDGFVADSLGWVFFQRSRAARAAGDTHEASRWLESARAKLEEAHSLTGGDPVISEHLGDVYLALGQKRVALEKYEQAVTLTPRAGEQPELGAKLERLRRELGAQ